MYILNLALTPNKIYTFIAILISINNRRLVHELQKKI